MTLLGILILLMGAMGLVILFALGIYKLGEILGEMTERR